MVNLKKFFREVREDAATLQWEGIFSDYLDMVIKDPQLARLSHRRIYDMLQWSGISKTVNGSRRYKLFADELFGAERTIQQLEQLFYAASYVAEERRRIFLLMGPPGSGKSTLVTLIKKGLERYSRTDEGALYAISGCPMQEEPLHLVPENRRQELRQAYGINIEGDLCPRCRYNLRHQYSDDIAAVKVRRLTFAESEGIGIGSFVATSPEGQDMSRLVGSIDIDKLTEDRIEGAGKAFRLDGELQAANRGIMEFIQIFRSDDTFLTVILGVTQEQVIKLGSFGSVYADETIIAHSNESEYKTFIKNQQTEALMDRLILMKVPYNLRVSEEIKIYRKLLSNNHSSNVHISPLTLPAAASMAIISRLEDGKRVAGLPKVSLIDKVKMYDGKAMTPYSKDDIIAIRDDSVREGMFGLSPRFMVNRLADGIARGQDCLTPLDALQGLAEGLSERTGISVEEQVRLSNLLPEIIKTYEDLALIQVQQAATEQYTKLAQTHLETYIDNVETLSKSRSSDSSLNPPINDQLIRRTEGALYIRDSERAAFRKDIQTTYSALRNGGKKPTLQDFPLLNTAIEKLLLPNARELGQILKTRQTDSSRLQQNNHILERLKITYGYCNKCSEELIHSTLRILKHQNVASLKKGKLIRH